MSSTRAALLTPPGRSAVATVRVQGPLALQAVRAHFQPSGKLSLMHADTRRVLFGLWSESPPDVFEEVVVCRVETDCIDVHCHGGAAASARILRSLKSHAVVETEWSELTAVDQLTTEIHQALSEARTETVAAILLDQQRGALHRALSHLRRALEISDPDQCHQLLDPLLEYRKLGRRLTDPWQVALVGAPNVGKSSLINRLVGYRRAIVYDQPGTTRDVVTAETVIRGWPVQFADTAGIRETDEPIEAAGVERAVEQAKSCDLKLIVMDAENLDEQPLPDLENHQILVLNKIDKVDPQQLTLPPHVMPTSAIDGTGIERLIDQIGGRLVGDPLPAGTPMPFHHRHFQILDGIVQAVADEDFSKAMKQVDEWLFG